MDYWTARYDADCTTDEKCLEGFIVNDVVSAKRGMTAEEFFASLGVIGATLDHWNETYKTSYAVTRARLRNDAGI